MHIICIHFSCESALRCRLLRDLCLEPAVISAHRGPLKQSCFVKAERKVSFYAIVLHTVEGGTAVRPGEDLLAGDGGQSGHELEARITTWLASDVSKDNVVAKFRKLSESTTTGLRRFSLRRVARESGRARALLLQGERRGRGRPLHVPELWRFRRSGGRGGGHGRPCYLPTGSSTPSRYPPRSQNFIGNRRLEMEAKGAGSLDGQLVASHSV